MEFNSSNKLHTLLQPPISHPHTTAFFMAGRKKIKNKTSENTESKLKEIFKNYSFSFSKETSVIPQLPEKLIIFSVF